MRLDKLLAEQIIELIDRQTHKLLGAIQDGRVVLGGSAGSMGGIGDPPIGFWGQLRQGNITYDTAGSTRACAAGSSGSDSLVDNLDAIRLGYEICDDAIVERHIDWGFGAGQISAVDIPFQSTSGSIDATNVRDAIEETYAEGGGGSAPLGDHTHSGPGDGGNTLVGHTVTGDLIMDDGAGDSPQIQLVGGSNDDTALLFLDDDAVAGRSDLVIRLPGNTTGNSHFEVQDSVGGRMFIVYDDGYIYLLRVGTEPTVKIVNDYNTTDDAREVLRLYRTRAAGGAVAGFGGRLKWTLPDGADSEDDAGAIDVVWSDPTDTSEDSYMRFLVRVGGAALAEMCRIDGGGLVMAAGKSIDMVTDVNEFSTDGTLAGNSDSAIPTEKAVKTYVDANPGVASGVIVLWDNSDTCPTGYTKVTGSSSRVLYYVTSGAGGTAGAANHSHTLSLYSQYTSRAYGRAVGDWPSLGGYLGYDDGAGTLTYNCRLATTDSQAHLYSAYKVLL